MSLGDFYGFSLRGTFIDDFLSSDYWIDFLSLSINFFFVWFGLSIMLYNRYGYLRLDYIFQGNYY